MLEHSAWIRRLGVRVPLRSRHFLSQKLWQFPKNTLSCVENECCYLRTVNESNCLIYWLWGLPLPFLQIGLSSNTLLGFNTLRPRQNGRHFADDIFQCIFLNENAWISLKISLKFVPKGPINNNPAFVQIMAWRRSGDKPLSEPMMVSLMTHICVTRPQWVKCNTR